MLQCSMNDGLISVRRKAMTTSKKTETEETKDISHTFLGFREHLVEGVDVLLRMHKEWVDTISKQQTQMFTALRDGVGQIEKAINQATDRYRTVTDAWGTRLSDVVHRTAA